MDEFEGTFQHWPECQVLICREHRTAILSTSLKRHVQRKHREITATVCQVWVDQAMRLSQAGSLARTVSEIQYPEEPPPAMKYLDYWSDGKKCIVPGEDDRPCGHMRRTRSDIQDHCRLEHNWVNPRKRGGKPGVDVAGGFGEQWVDGICCQKLGQTGALQKLFEVVAPAPTPTIRVSATRQDSEDTSQLMDKFEGLLKAIGDGDRTASAVVGKQARISSNIWIRRTGWPKHLRGFDRQWLAGEMRKPNPEKEREKMKRELEEARPERGRMRGDSDDEDSSEENEEADLQEWVASEQALAVASLAVERVIWRAQRASQSEVVGAAAVNHIERREAGGQANEKPFNAGQVAKTMKKYSAHWAAIVAYVWRTSHLEVFNGMEELGEMEPGEEDDDDDSEVEGVARGESTQPPRARIRDRRPPYHLTKAQAEAFARVRGAAYTVIERRNSQADDDSAAEDPEGDEADQKGKDLQVVERCVLAYLLSMLDHDIADNEFQNVMISALAVLGVQIGRSWRQPGEYTPILSAVVTVSRMLVLYRAKQARDDEITYRQRVMLESEEEARDKAKGYYDRVVEMTARFMTIVEYGGRPTPMDSILRLRAYGMKIHKNTNADGVIDWHGDELLFGHIQFSMASLRMMIHGMLHTAREQLWRDILLLETDDEGAVMEGSTAAPVIHWDRLVDDAHESRSGWSFVDDARNKEAFGGVDGKTWLISRCSTETQLRGRFIKSRPAGDGEDESIPWDMDGIQKYGDAMKAFRAILLVLMHMSGGQPARGTEIVTIQYKNGFEGDTRGIFIEDGLVVYVTTYIKTMSRSAKADPIHRYLPREVGELVVYYILIAIPFWRILVKGGSNGMSDWGSPYIWEPQKEIPWQFPGSEKKGKEGKKRRPREDEDESGDDDSEGESQARSGSRVRRRLEVPSQLGSQSRSRSRSQAPGVRIVTNGRYQHVWEPERWGTGQVTRVLQKMTMLHIGEKLGVSAWRHSCKAIFERHIRDQDVVKFMRSMDPDEEEKQEEHASDQYHKQSGHGVSMGESIYGRSISEASNSTFRKRYWFRRVSREWHVFLMFNSALEAGGGQAGGRDERATTGLGDMIRQATVEEDRRWKLMRKVDLQGQLEEVLGRGAQFRGVQEPALRAIMRQESPVVVIMGTGGGKSLLFIIPARCSRGGLTVVVVPLVSLRNDIKDRCDELGIDCVEWSGGRPHEWASVVLVTPESAVGESFGHFINRQRAKGRLDRIVIDECHAVLDSGKGGRWRTRMLALRGLVKAETQMVYLTATMRPKDVPEFKGLMGLSDGARWFRCPTTRPNVRYQIQRYKAGEKSEEEVLAALVEEKKQQYGERGQIIVYCDTVQKTVQYAKKLKAVCFHREVGTADEKREVVRQLKSGRRQVFTATCALGMGLDAPTIRVVIHAGWVRRLRDYAQESGRAGRDGLGSEAIILRAVRHDRRGRPIQETAEQVESRGQEREMWEFIESQTCVRVIMDREMDGRMDRVGCEDGEERCYRCQAVADRHGREAELSRRLDELDGEETRAEMGEGGGIEGGRAVRAVGEAAAAEEVAAEAEIYRARTQRRAQGWDERIYQSKEALEVARLREICEEWGRGCTWCKATGEGEVSSHILEDCTEEEAESIREMVKKMKEGPDWERFSCCFDCGLPQAICNRFEMKEEVGGFRKIEGGRCQFPNVLIEAVVSMWGANGSIVEEYFQRQIQDRGIERDEEREKRVQGIIGWLKQKIRWGGIESNEMSRAIVRMERLIREEKEG